MNIGFGITASYCTHQQILKPLQQLVDSGYNVYPIVTENVLKYDTRFGSAEEFLKTVKDITKNAVKRELCLIKVNIPNEKARAEIIQYVNIFRAKIVDVTEETLIVEITGDIEKNNAFISLLKTNGIKKISRTGLTAMARGV